MPEVRVYTTRFCAYCVAAKRLLGARHIAYDEIDVTRDDASRAWLVEKTGRKTVPQIFVGARAIGGYQELVALDRSGRLAAMLHELSQETLQEKSRNSADLSERQRQPPEQ
jgi:glutaredoxin 3